MEQQALETQFKELTGRSKVKELIKHLQEATERDAAFAMPATVDAVNCISALVKSHTNATDRHIEDGCGLVCTALFNALTNTDVVIEYPNNYGKPVPYTDDEEEC